MFNAERAVIAAMLKGGEEIIKVVAPLLEVQDFVDDVYGFLYERMRTRWLDRQAADVFTLADDLKVAESGGDEMLASLLREPVEIANIADYANIVYRDSMLRQIASAGQQTGEYSKESVDFRGVLAASQSMLDGIAERDASREDGDIRRILSEGRAEKDTRSQLSRPLGFTTGMPQYDTLSDGLRRKHVHLASAYNSVGKSWVAVNAILGFLRDGARVSVFSLEMSDQQWSDRLLANIAGIDSRRVARLRFLSNDEAAAYREADEWLGAQPLRIYTRARTISRIQRLVRYDKPDVIVLDYVQKLEGERGESRYETITRGFNKFAEICDGSNCGGLCLSQISEEQRFDKSKTFSGEARAKGSGDVGAAADFATEYKRDKMETPNIIDAYYVKNRHGPTGYAQYHIDLATGRLEQLSATI